MRRRIAFWLMLAVLPGSRPAGAQTAPWTPSTAPDSLAVPEPPPSRATKSPGLALLSSALLPGAGQVYNESYWKVPVIVGFGVYFTSQWLHYNRLTVEARDRWRESLLVTPGGDLNQERLREFYKEQRDTYTWYMAILYLLNLADAYVDAALYDFDVGEDLSLRVLPDAGPRITLQLRFHQ